MFFRLEWDYSGTKRYRNNHPGKSYPLKDPGKQILILVREENRIHYTRYLIKYLKTRINLGTSYKEAYPKLLPHLQHSRFINVRFLCFFFWNFPSKNFIVIVYSQFITADLIADFSRPYALPFVSGRHEDLKSITSETLASLINGEFNAKVNSFKIIDCRFVLQQQQ